MKKEIEVAKRSINGWKMTKPDDNELWRLNVWMNRCQEHKATCERFLEFLKKQEKLIEAECLEDCCDYKKGGKGNMCYICIHSMKNKEEIADLKNAIKLYTGVGI